MPCQLIAARQRSGIETALHCPLCRRRRRRRSASPCIFDAQHVPSPSAPTAYNSQPGPSKHRTHMPHGQREPTRLPSQSLDEDGRPRTSVWRWGAVVAAQGICANYSGDAPIRVGMAWCIARARGCRQILATHRACARWRRVGNATAAGSGVLGRCSGGWFLQDTKRPTPGRPCGVKLAGHENNAGDVATRWTASSCWRERVSQCCCIASLGQAHSLG